MEKQTLGEIASQKLLEMIQRDGYTAGDKLPTEAELVELLGLAATRCGKLLEFSCPEILSPYARAQAPLFQTKTVCPMIPWGLP